MLAISGISTYNKMKNIRTVSTSCHSGVNVVTVWSHLEFDHLSMWLCVVAPINADIVAGACECAEDR